MWIVVSVVFTLVIMGASLFFVFRLLGGLRKQAQEEQRLLQTGAPATGQIMAVNQTGTYINQQPQVQIVVMVHPQGGQPYQAQLTKVVSMFETAQYQIGAQVHVRYDPQNPAKIAIATQQQVMQQNPMMMQQGMQQPGMQQQQPGMQQPQQGGYPPQGGGYPPQGGGAPPNFGA
jgi:hypothetical protein